MSDKNSSKYHVEWQGNTKQQAMDHLFYNAVMYLPLDEIKNINGKTVNKISELVSALPISEAEQNMLKFINEMIRNNEAENYGSVLVNHYSGTMGYHPEAISAAVFNRNGRNSIVYRGTPSKAWLDNSDTLNGLKKEPFKDKFNTEWWDYLSEIDVLALQYFEAVDCQYQAGSLNVSGHSKGGHQAMVAALLYSDQIRSCYAFDGQGISPEMWAELTGYFGEQRLHQIRDKIYGLNVANDYVHPLGWTKRYGYIAAHLYIIVGSAGRIEDNHTLQAFLTEGRFNAISLDGEGILARFLMEVSDRLMELREPAERKLATDAVMLWLQVFQGGAWPYQRNAAEIAAIVVKKKDGLRLATEIIAEVLIVNEPLRVEMVKYLASTKRVPLSQFWLSCLKEAQAIQDLIHHNIFPQKSAVQKDLLLLLLEKSESIAKGDFS